MGYQPWAINDDKPLRRFCPMPRIWRSFAVLRRLSLAMLAQRLRQAQDDNLSGIVLSQALRMTVGGRE